MRRFIIAMGIGSSILGGLGQAQTTTAVTSAAPATTSAAASSSVVSSSAVAVPSSAPVAAAAVAPVGGATVANTVLVLARTDADVYTASSGLNGYGIPYQSVLVPQSGVALPVLNSSATNGNYAGIITHAELSYDFGGGNFSSALTAAQWQQLFDYQVMFNVRMVRLDVFPGPSTDTSTTGGSGADEQLSFTDVSAFPGAGLKPNAGVSVAGLYHYPATIVNATTTKQIAQFGTAGTAAVINTFGARKQMAFFTSLATQWSLASNYAQHAWIHWMMRGLFAGRRRVLLSTQIDDVHLITDLYRPVGGQFRVRREDLAAHIPWVRDINSRLPAGSKYMIELGHNGNGDIENATASNTGPATCNPPEAIEYDEQIDTPLEFQKALGTGTNIWPTTPTTYGWSVACAALDPLANWFRTAANRDAYMHISHTFTHMGLNNATYSDAAKEIQFNQAWLRQIAITGNAVNFSPKGIIPPAITGLHNGDVIKAWMDNGLTAVVGDNTRPVLMNQQNEYWPLITTVPANGFAGLLIIPRWATTIYYNCDLPACTTQEWVDTSAGTNDFNVLLNDARSTNMRHLLGLHQDPFMFHQANMRQIDVATTTVGSKTGKFSLLQIWTETIVQELTRLTTWPVITLKQDDIATQFRSRMQRDACKYNIAHKISADGKTITSVTVTATNNRCNVPIPVTFPGDANVSGAGTATKDKLGSDPLTMYVTLAGQPVTINLATPLAV